MNRRLGKVPTGGTEMQSLELRAAQRPVTYASGKERSGRRGGKELTPSAGLTLLVSILVAGLNVVVASGRSGGPGLVGDLLFFGLCLLLLYVLDWIVGDGLSLGRGPGSGSSGHFDPERFARSECDSAVALGSDRSAGCVSDGFGERE
jgi:hypothetical protein